MKTMGLGKVKTFVMGGLDALEGAPTAKGAHFGGELPLGWGWEHVRGRGVTSRLAEESALRRPSGRHFNAAGR